MPSAKPGDTEKLCPKCKTVKALSEFGNNIKLQDGLTCWCRSCNSMNAKSHRERHPERVKRWARSGKLAREYGITIEDYNRMVIEQSGRCAICATIPAGDGLTFRSRDVLNIDHCHATGRVRGLLCWDCNTALGKFGDNLDRLRNAVKYMENSCL